MENKAVILDTDFVTYHLVLLCCDNETEEDSYCTILYTNPERDLFAAMASWSLDSSCTKAARCQGSGSAQVRARRAPRAAQDDAAVWARRAGHATQRKVSRRIFLGCM